MWLLCCQNYIYISFLWSFDDLTFKNQVDILKNMIFMKPGTSLHISKHWYSFRCVKSWFDELWSLWFTFLLILIWKQWPYALLKSVLNQTRPIFWYEMTLTSPRCYAYVTLSIIHTIEHHCYKVIYQNALFWPLSANQSILSHTGTKVKKGLHHWIEDRKTHEIG